MRLRDVVCVQEVFGATEGDHLIAIASEHPLERVEGSSRRRVDEARGSRGVGLWNRPVASLSTGRDCSDADSIRAPRSGVHRGRAP